jgi:4-amino-4-deoxy-L-arabinose transferase-like glycosyltransferase
MGEPGIVTSTLKNWPFAWSKWSRTPQRAVSASAAKRRTELTWLLIILLVAAFFRLWRLDSVPPSLTHDEANNVHDAMAVLDGVRPLYFPVAQGKEPLYPYSVAAHMSLLGRSPWTTRLASAAWGLSLILLAYAWTRRAFGPTVALLTAAGLAVGFWPVATSRMGLRAITLPVLFTAAIWFLWQGGESAHWRVGESADQRVSESATRRGGAWLHFALAGLALGGSLYTYLAARVMPLVLVLFFVYLLSQRRLAWGVLLALVVAAVVAAPLLIYLAAHPSAEIRVGQLDQPLHALLQGDPGPLFGRLRETLPMLSVQGDSFIPYNIPGKPLLGPVTSVLFYAGLALALWHWRRPAYTLAVLWLVVGLSPALVTGIEAVNLRAIAAQPVVYLFPALTLQALGRWLEGVGLGRVVGRESPTESNCRGGRKLARQPLMVLGCVVLFAGVAVLTYRDYFLRWAQDRDVRVQYHTHLGAIADYVAAHPDQTFVISTLYPGQYHDPRVVEARLGGSGAHLRWADGRGAWVLPAGGAADKAVAFIVPTAVPLDPALASVLPPSVEWMERVSLRPDDFSPAFEVYRWREEAAPAGPALARLGDQLLFLGADLRASRLAPGEVLELLTTWQVIESLPADRDAVLFAQVLDAAGNVVAQQDRLDTPSWNWHPGDRFIQLLRLPLPAELNPGEYRLIVGTYTVPDRVDAVLAGREPDPSKPRLPVVSGGVAGGDFIELPFIEVLGDG